MLNFLYHLKPHYCSFSPKLLNSTYFLFLCLFFHLFPLMHLYQFIFLNFAIPTAIALFKQFYIISIATGTPTFLLQSLSSLNLNWGMGIFLLIRTHTLSLVGVNTPTESHRQCCISMNHCFFTRGRDFQFLKLRVFFQMPLCSGFKIAQSYWQFANTSVPE